MSRDARGLLRWLQVVLAFVLLAGCSRRAAPPASSEQVEMKTNAAPAADVVAKGADIYEQTCAMCHYDGSGSPVAPPLKGSTMLATSPKDVILAILKGQQGKSVVNGKPFNGLMPAQEWMSDGDIAAVVTFVRKQFAGVEETITPAEVAALR